jgi:hypothetical protein
MSDRDTAVIIAVGPEHLQSKIYERAIASVEAQTAPARYIVAQDPLGRGPAVVRNEALRRVEERWLVFLDADDELEPKFVEQCLGSRAWPNKYVFTDWYQDGVHMRPPDNPWCQLSARRTQGGSWQPDGDGVNHWVGGTGWHVITTLLPTHWVRHIHGFDETMGLGGEDTAFYWKLTRAGCCGVHLPLPLMHYHNTPDSRAKRWERHPKFNRTMSGILSQYEGMMGCCGDKINVQTGPVGAKQEGDILAVPLWMGKRSETGRATGRIYKGIGNYHMAWIHPADVGAAPGLFRPVQSPPPPPLPPQDESTHDEPTEKSFAEAAQAIGKRVAHSDGAKPYRPLVEVQPALSWQGFIATGRRALDAVTKNCTRCGKVIGIGQDDNLCQECRDSFWNERWQND